MQPERRRSAPRTAGAGLRVAACGYLRDAGHGIQACAGRVVGAAPKVPRRSRRYSPSEVSMRRIVVVFGALAVVMLAIGIAEKPRATQGDAVVASVTTNGADMPATIPDAATSPPVVQAAPGSRLEAQRLLRARDFPALTRLIEAKEVRAEADVQHEDEL